MSRLLLRRERILPGPLKVLQPAERRSPVPVTALVLTSAALAAGLLLMPHLSHGLSVDPTPMVAFADADAEPAALAYSKPQPLIVAATPAPVESSAAAPGPVVQVASEPVRPAPAKPIAEASLFQLDLLPVLRADGADLETGALPAPAPQRAASKTPSRRAAASNRGTALAATGDPAQH